MHQCYLHFILLDIRRHAGGPQRAALPPSRRSAGSGCRVQRAKFGFRPDPAVACRLPRGRIFLRRAQGRAEAVRKSRASGRPRTHPRVRQCALEHPPIRLANAATALAHRIHA